MPRAVRIPAFPFSRARLRYQACRGPVDLGLEYGRRGPVPSAVVRDLCLDAGGDIQQLVLQNAVIDGCLDLSDTSVKHSLTFIDCTFDDGVRLSGARLERPIEFVACELEHLDAEYLKGRATSCFAGARPGRRSLVPRSGATWSSPAVGYGPRVASHWTPPKC